MILLRMLAFRPVSAEQHRQTPRSAPPAQSRAVASSEPEQKEKVSPVPTKATKSPVVVGAGGDWRSLVEHMQLKGVLRELAMNCALKDTDHSLWKLALDTSHRQLLSEVRRQRLEQSLGEYLQKTVRVEIEVQDSAANTPAQQQQQEAQTRQDEAVKAIESDPNVKAIQKVFDATVHRETIRSLE